jgi:hypothetical protein
MATPAKTHATETTAKTATIYATSAGQRVGVRPGDRSPTRMPPRVGSGRVGGRRPGRALNASRGGGLRSSMAIHKYFPEEATGAAVDDPSQPGCCSFV